MRTLLLIGGTLLFLAALVQLLTVRQTLRERATDSAFGPANVLTLTHAVMHQNEGNTLRMQVWADKSIYSQERSRAHLINVRFKAFPKPGRDVPQEPIEGVAAEAEVRGDRSLLELLGQVRIQQGTRTEVRGERLTYDYGQGLITSDDPVWIRHDLTIHEGTTLRYSIADEQIRLTRPLVWQ